MSMFKKAERKQARLRLALSGPSGAGKTTGALLIAKGLGGKIAFLDTERGSASLYSDIVDFDVVNLTPPYTPENYIKIIHAAEQEGYDTLIIDSITHEWSGEGGLLEANEALAKNKYRGNTWSAFSETTPRHQKFIDAMLASPMHIIVTMRSKTEFAEVELGNGKKTYKKFGTKVQQRDGIEYEFTCVLDIETDTHYACASKDRTRLFIQPVVLSEQTGVILLDWLNNGSGSQEPAQKPEPAPVEPFDLQEVAQGFADCPDLESLTRFLKSLSIAGDHPQREEIGKLWAKRKAELSKN